MPWREQRGYRAQKPPETAKETKTAVSVRPINGQEMDKITFSLTRPSPVADTAVGLCSARGLEVGVTDSRATGGGRTGLGRATGFKGPR